MVSFLSLDFTPHKNFVMNMAFSRVDFLTCGPEQYLASVLGRAEGIRKLNEIQGGRNMLKQR